MDSIELKPIGHVVSQRKAKEDDYWGSVDCYIQLDEKRFSPDSLMGLEEFSHVLVLFFLDKIDPASIQMHARHPRDNPNWPKVGIFAQRGAVRPNRIGVTVCRIKRVDGLKLELEALDAIDGTPVLDIKPCVYEFGPQGELIQPQWMTELMQNYWKF